MSRVKFHGSHKILTLHMYVLVLLLLTTSRTSQHKHSTTNSQWQCDSHWHYIGLVLH